MARPREEQQEIYDQVSDNIRLCMVLLDDDSREVLCLASRTCMAGSCSPENREILQNTAEGLRSLV
jgi:hypothetical protein